MEELKVFSEKNSVLTRGYIELEISLEDKVSLEDRVSFGNNREGIIIAIKKLENSQMVKLFYSKQLPDRMIKSWNCYE